MANELMDVSGQLSKVFDKVTGGYGTDDEKQAAATLNAIYPQLLEQKTMEEYIANFESLKFRLVEDPKFNEMTVAQIRKLVALITADKWMDARDHLEDLGNLRTGRARTN